MASFRMLDDPVPKASTLVTTLPKDFELLRTRKTSDYWGTLGWDYLVERGITAVQIRRHEVGVSLVGVTHHRVVFPVLDEDGVLAGYSARSIVKAEPKWLHSLGLRTGYIAARSKKTVVVTEGVFDALAVARYSQYRVGAVALLGTKLTTSKYKLVSRYQTVVLWFDPDEAGREAITKLGPELSDRGHRVWIVQSTGDPAELSQTEVVTSLRERRPWSYGDQSVYSLPEEMI